MTKISKIISELNKIPDSNSTKRRVKCLIEIIAFNKISKEKQIKFYSGTNSSIIGLHNYQCDIQIKTDFDSYKLINNPYTIHAESSVIHKFFSDVAFINDVIIEEVNIYCTTAPCVECTKEILLSFNQIDDNFKTTLYFGESKSTFANQHQKTQTDALIPFNVLKSCGLDVHQCSHLLDYSKEINSDIQNNSK